MHQMQKNTNSSNQDMELNLFHPKIIWRIDRNWLSLDFEQQIVALLQLSAMMSNTLKLFDEWQNIRQVFSDWLTSACLINTYYHYQNQWMLLIHKIRLDTASRQPSIIWEYKKAWLKYQELVIKKLIRDLCVCLYLDINNSFLTKFE